MPELPEVETIRNNLRQGSANQAALPGRMIRNSELSWGRTLAFPTLEEFQHRLSGQTILDINRRGKYLIFILSSSYLLFHLRMSGDLQVESSDQPLATHNRLVLHLDEGLRLSFVDPRKFGRVWLVDDPQQVLSSLGPEPFDPSLTADVLYTKLQQVNRQMKPLLLDQSFLAGLGNIYTDEALYQARIHPLLQSRQVGESTCEHLLVSIRDVLQEGIRRNGASIDWVYRGGDFQNYFQVYQRCGAPCPACGTPIERITVGQRGTHFCPSCQKLS